MVGNICTVTEMSHIGNDTPAQTFRPPRSSPSLSPLPNNILPATPSSKRCVTYPAVARKIFQTLILSDHQIAGFSRIHIVGPVSGSRHPSIQSATLLNHAPQAPLVVWVWGT
jgi:hypothetical protein